MPIKFKSPLKTQAVESVAQVATKAKTKSILTSDEMAAVDEIATLDAQLAEVAPLIKRKDELKKFLQSVAEDDTRFSGTQPVTLKGSTGVVEFGPRKTSREVTDLHGLIGKMKTLVGGYENLLDFIKIPLSAVDKYMSEAEQKAFIGNVEGARSLKSIRSKDA